MTTTTSPPAFAERLWPGPVGWLTTIGLGVVAAIAFWPVDPRLGVVIGAVTTIALVAGVVLATPRVEVRAGELRAGRAHVPVALLASPQVLRGDELRGALGPELDARAYVCLRGWIGSAVRADLQDPLDPTPYWVVSTRRPDLLVAALAAALPVAGADPAPEPGPAPDAGPAPDPGPGA